MRLISLFASVCLGYGLFSSPVWAHHSTSNIYDEAQTIEIQGIVRQWRLVNPHPFLIVEVTGPDGQTNEWDASFGGAAASSLRRRGYTPETFTLGEVVIVRGSPVRAEGVYGVLVRGDITREDGTPVP